MMNNRINQFKDYILHLDENTQCVHAKSVSSKWRDIYQDYPLLENIINNLMNEEGGFDISRADILNSVDSEEKVLKVFLWGYPYGFQGKENTKQAISNYSQIYELFQAKKAKKLTEQDVIELYDSLKNLERLGLSTISKLLYFFGFELRSTKLVIIDSRVLNALYCLNEIGILDCIGDNTDGDFYIRICKKIGRIAKEMEVRPEQLEFFLFKLGNFYMKNSQVLTRSIGDLLNTSVQEEMGNEE